MSDKTGYVYRKIELDWNGNVLAVEAEPYIGPWALCEGESDAGATEVAATDGNLLSLVDRGGKPFLGGAQFGESDAPAPGAVPAAPQDIDTPSAESDAVDPLAEAERLLAEPEEPEEQDDFEEDFGVPEEDRDKPIGRAARTIQQLRKRAQAAEDQNRQFLEQQLQFKAWADDMGRRYQLLEERLAQPQQPQRPQVPAEPPLDPNDPEYQLKLFQRQQREAWRKDFEQSNKPYLQRIEELEGKLQQQEQQRQQAAVSQRYNYAAEQAAMQMTQGFELEPDKMSRMNRALGTLALNAAYGWKTDPVSAGKVLDRLMTDYVLAKMRSRHAASKQQVQASRNAPATPAAGRGTPNARGQTFPTREEVEASGAKDELDLMFQRGGLVKA